MQKENSKTMFVNLPQLDPKFKLKNTNKIK